MKGAATAMLLAALLAGCGGGSRDKTTSVAKPPPATTNPPPPQSPQPTATTNTPPTHHRRKPQPLENTSTAPLRAGSTYQCGGSALKTIDARGPIKVQPPVVQPGHTFAVTITAKNVHTVVVSLAGVSLKPIEATAKPDHGNLTATIKMPAGAGCGNKLLDIEGDLTAEAFIGVSQ